MKTLPLAKLFIHTLQDIFGYKIIYFYLKHLLLIFKEMFYNLWQLTKTNFFQREALNTPK